MGLVLPTIEAYQVQHLPIVKVYADKIGLVEAINAVVPTEMTIDPGTIVLGMILDTLSGRSPLYRLEAFFTHQDTALLLGKAVAPEVFQDDTVGRVLDRLYDTGTMPPLRNKLAPEERADVLRVRPQGALCATTMASDQHGASPCRRKPHLRSGR
jgi:hypothetical protein